MITALQIGLLLVLIALIGIILGYLFGKLSCKKQTNDAYISKNDYCESEYVATNNSSSDANSEQPSILSSDNMATVNESAAAETLLNEEPQSIVSSSGNESVSGNVAPESNSLEDNSITAGDISSESATEASNDVASEEKQSFASASNDSKSAESSDDNTATKSELESDKKELNANSSTDSDTNDANEENKKDEDEGKPKVLNAPRDGKADNLCRIKGVGFVIEEKLQNLGVFHFDQIAAWTEKEIEWIDSHLAFSGRIKRESWIAQAEKLASGEETEFSKRVDKGSVSTSRKSTGKEKA